MDPAKPGAALPIIVLGFFLVAGVCAVLFRDALLARKIQPGTFKWSNVRVELRRGLLNLLITTITITVMINGLKGAGLIRFQTGPASGWVIAGEYFLSFFLFDAYFYWAHRIMHKEPYYSWVHKLHHLSTAPVPITSWSMNPVEGVIEGLFTPLFLAAFTIHAETVPFIVPTNILMGLYVHSGFEILPRWWNRSWLTKWFISASFHDEHHHHFTGNYGGYTTIWDRLCGTMRKKYESNYDKTMDRAAEWRNSMADNGASA